jgi:ABC-2 type transport system ATP-binding protein
MEMEEAIKIKELTKQFDHFTAVNHIYFQVFKGEIFGFLGPNGAGKTTTIRMMTGVLPPDYGTATVLGYDILKNPIQVKELISVVPEMANAYLDLTAWQNLMLVGELYGVSKKEIGDRAESLLKELGLYGRRGQLVRGFSRGMKQKLILCMALLPNPRVLFLDEPTSGLDVESTRLIRKMILDLSSVETTVFLTTHNMDEANQLCDRIAIINHGKIAAIDTPRNLRMKSSGLKSVEISFNKPASIDELSNLANVDQVKKIGDKIQLYTETPHNVIENLLKFTRSANLTITSLNILAPSLEDIFLKLISEKEDM